MEESCYVEVCSDDSDHTVDSGWWVVGGGREEKGSRIELTNNKDSTLRFRCQASGLAGHPSARAWATMLNGHESLQGSCDCRA